MIVIISIGFLGACASALLLVFWVDKETRRDWPWS